MSIPRDHAHHPRHAPVGEATDSADVPWARRELSPSGFETDTGGADPTVRALLTAHGEGVAADADLVAALSTARLLVAIVADATEVHDDGPLAVDHEVSLAAVTLLSPDGERALPVFTGTDSLAAWDPAARPVPVAASRAAQAALAEGADVLVVDVSGPAPTVLRSSMIWALAHGRAWLPAHDDPVVAAAVAAAVGAEEGIAAYAIEEGRPLGTGTLGVVLEVAAGRTPEEVRGLATRVGEALASDTGLRERIDGLAFRIIGPAPG